ncbi:helix-turn-helix domain-containing protein [Mesorhizobium sp.]|uniref:helix-turn-helix domain-containing protein n=1 Tax=Mesorhizobium sp. TaxID=1871066 RepID=UPI0025C45012|nr:helix-turn-helix domain-containing protein [Mesorhizobium sp.]
MSAALRTSFASGIGILELALPALVADCGCTSGDESRRSTPLVAALPPPRWGIKLFSWKGDLVITPQQIRTARTMLGWTQKHLARAAELSEMAVKNIERGATADPRPATVSALRQALEAGGVEFLGQTTRVGQGVRLRAAQTLIAPKNLSVTHDATSPRP